MSFHIVVCIKSVITEAPDKRVIRTPEKCGMNPFDRPALETALGIKEKTGGTVTALSMGPAVAASALYEAMSMGIDRGVLLSDPCFAGSDTLATSNVLVAAIKKLAPCDLILFGTRTSDSDTGQVGPQTSVQLGLPLVTCAHSIEYTDSGLLVERRADDFLEKFQVSLPAVLTIHPSSVQPRDASLSGIETAFEKKEFETWDMAALDLSSDQVGDPGSPTKVLSMKRVKRDRKCEFVDGSAGEQVDALVNRLLEAGLIG